MRQSFWTPFLWFYLYARFDNDNIFGLRHAESAALNIFSACNSTDSTLWYNLSLVIKFENTGSGISCMVDYLDSNVFNSDGTY